MPSAVLCSWLLLWTAAFHEHFLGGFELKAKECVSGDRVPDEFLFTTARIYTRLRFASTDCHVLPLVRRPSDQTCG
jgi:hypothetical protein